MCKQVNSLIIDQHVCTLCVKTFRVFPKMCMYNEDSRDLAKAQTAGQHVCRVRIVIDYC